VASQETERGTGEEKTKRCDVGAVSCVRFRNRGERSRKKKRKEGGVSRGVALQAGGFRSGKEQRNRPTATEPKAPQRRNSGGLGGDTE